MAELETPIPDTQTVLPEKEGETAEKPAEIKTVSCSKCGATSTLPQYYRKSFGKYKCPACAHKADIRNNKILFGFFGLLLLYDLLTKGANYGWFSYEAWTVVNVILILFGLILLHELSHALAAKLMGGQVFGIQMGIGRQIFSRWFNDFYLGIRILPVSGVCFAGFPTNDRIRLKYAVFISGGLVFHAVTAALVWGWIRQNGLTHSILLPLLTMNVLLLVINALPHSVNTINGKQDSDGKYLFRILLGRFTIKEMRLNYYRLASFNAFQRLDFEKARHLLQAGLAANPGDDVLENLRVFLLLNEEDKLEEANTAWKAMLDSEKFNEFEPILQAIYYNNYAWTTLMHRPEPDSVAVARHYSEKAYSMTPWIPTIKGTLAAIMVEQGEFFPAVDWALEAAHEHDLEQNPLKGRNIASNLATAAIGYHRMGSPDLAAQYLGQARELAGEELAVIRAVAEIEGGDTAVSQRDDLSLQSTS